MPKLTKASVDRAAPGPTERFLWDEDPKGFGVKIFPSGIKTFIFQYRTPEGQSRRLTIGKMSDALTLNQARDIARGHAVAVHQGRDPQVEKKARRSAITVNDLLDDYLQSEAFAGKAESTRAIDRGRMERHVRPLLGKEVADKLTPERVKAAHREITEGKTAARVKTGSRGLARVSGGVGTANKAVLVLSAALKWGVDSNLVKQNVAGIAAKELRAGRTGKREVIIEGADEYRRLFTALQRLESTKVLRPAAADAIRFIALTGARRGEATGLRWAWVDLKAGRIAIPAKHHKGGHKTGEQRIIMLPSEAQAIIARQPKGEPDDFVFAPAKGEGALSLGHVWPKVRTEAGLPANLGMHGLRHSIGTHLAMAGASTVELMETLGHKQVATTLRYVHFGDSARSTLAERAASVALAGLKADDEKVEVVPLKKTDTAA